SVHAQLAADRRRGTAGRRRDAPRLPARVARDPADDHHVPVAEVRGRWHRLHRDSGGERVGVHGERRRRRTRAESGGHGDERRRRAQRDARAVGRRADGRACQHVAADRDRERTGGPVAGGGGGGGGGGGAPNLAVTLAASAVRAAPDGVIGVTAIVTNLAAASATQTHLRIALSAGLALVGTPQFEIGSGCTGTQAIDCNLDFLGGGRSTRVVFQVRTSATGAQTITATGSAAGESNLTNHTATVTIQVDNPAPP